MARRGDLPRVDRGLHRDDRAGSRATPTRPSRRPAGVTAIPSVAAMPQRARHSHERLLALRRRAACRSAAGARRGRRITRCAATDAARWPSGSASWASPTTIDCAAERPVARPIPPSRRRARRSLLRPELARHLVRPLADGKQRGDRADRRRALRRLLLADRADARRLPGVADVSVNASARRARIVYDASAVSLAGIVDALARVGYRALPLDRAALDDARRRETRDAQKRLAVAGFGAMQAMMYASALWFGAFDGADVATRDFFRWLTLLAADAGRPLLGGAVFRRRRAPRSRAPARDGRAGRARRCADLCRQRRRGRHRRPRRVVRVGQHVRVLPVRRPLSRDARAPPRGRPVRRAGAADAGVRRSHRARRIAAARRRHRASCPAIAWSSPTAAAFRPTACSRAASAASTKRCSAASRRRSQGVAATPLVAGSMIVGTPATVRVTRVGADTVVAGIVALTRSARRARGRAWRATASAQRRVSSRACCCSRRARRSAGRSSIPTRAFAATVAVLVVACPCAFALAAPAAVTRALAALTRPWRAGRAARCARGSRLGDARGVRQDRAR